jgi:exopolyphosphatase/guanosine-5'-triphosphate,3'-diphosphate pyrophosphatase
MATQPATIDALCAAYHNEEPHARHVASLALRLFDRLANRCALHRSDRRLLEAACRLHDIGYSIDPRDHARVGARIILGVGLYGFTKQEASLIAAGQDRPDDCRRHPVASGRS